MKRILILTIALGLLVSGTASAHWRNAFDTVLKDYDRVRLTLARNSLDGVEKYAGRLQTELVHLDKNITARHAGVPRGAAVDVHKNLPAMIDAADRLRTAKTLEQARAAFLELSRGLARWHRLVIKKHRAFVVACADDDELWLQAKKYRRQILNPYEPEKQARCEPATTDK